MAVGQKKYKKTEERLKKLHECLRADMSVREACSIVDISEKTYYNWIDDDPELLQSIEIEKRYIEAKAKQNIYNDILSGNIATSKWLLERRQPENYSQLRKQKEEEMGMFISEEDLTD